MSIIMVTMIASLQEILKLTDAQINAFVADFEFRLPEYLRKALQSGCQAA